MVGIVNQTQLLDTTDLLTESSNRLLMGTDLIEKYRYSGSLVAELRLFLVIQDSTPAPPPPPHLSGELVHVVGEIEVIPEAICRHAGDVLVESTRILPRPVGQRDERHHRLVDETAETHSEVFRQRSQRGRHRVTCLIGEGVDTGDIGV